MHDNAATIQQGLADNGYVADRSLATTLALMDHLQRPLLVEGDAGVGKTALARALADMHGRDLIRLQCYEGLDIAAAVYEWNYPHQLLTIKLLESSDESLTKRESEIFSERFLLPRPLLQAISAEQGPVLLIDEIDRADEEFEAYLLEVLSEFQVSIPELGTIRARSIPRVVLTSNATRELSDALRRRCLYLYLDYPDMAKELAVVRSHLPEAEEAIARQAVVFMHGLRELDLRKKPGIAETLDWVAALMGLEVRELSEDVEVVRETLACIIKTREDRSLLDEQAFTALLARTTPAGQAGSPPLS